jgi:hypothetical protein
MAETNTGAKLSLGPPPGGTILAHEKRKIQEIKSRTVCLILQTYGFPQTGLLSVLALIFNKEIFIITNTNGFFVIHVIKKVHISYKPPFWYAEIFCSKS